MLFRAIIKRVESSEKKEYTITILAFQVLSSSLIDQFGVIG